MGVRDKGRSNKILSESISSYHLTFSIYLKKNTETSSGAHS